MHIAWVGAGKTYRKENLLIFRECWTTTNGLHFIWVMFDSIQKTKTCLSIPYVLYKKNARWTTSAGIKLHKFDIDSCSFTDPSMWLKSLKYVFVHGHVNACYFSCRGIYFFGFWKIKKENVYCRSLGPFKHSVLMII